MRGPERKKGDPQEGGDQKEERATHKVGQERRKREVTPKGGTGMKNDDVAQKEAQLLSLDFTLQTPVPFTLNWPAPLPAAFMRNYCGLFPAPSP